MGSRFFVLAAVLLSFALGLPAWTGAQTDAGVAPADAAPAAQRPPRTVSPDAPTMGAAEDGKVRSEPAEEKPAVVRAFEAFVEVFAGIVFFPIFGVPLVVWVLVCGSLFFTLRMGFINVRGFKHAIQITRGKYDNPDDPGEISHFQALTSALSATVGLGNIAGVAVAVGAGGAGAVFWMLVIAFFGMTAKFVECTLAQVWRKVDADGVVSGGPMYYLSVGLKERGLGGFGRVLGALFAVCIIGGAFGGGNMFQANQSYELAAAQVPLLAESAWLYGILLAGLVGVVILGGIKRIGAATSKIVPFMAVLYIGASLWILITNIERLPGVLGSIFTQAFAADAVFGGTMGALVLGMKRAVFSNEAGIGSAAIAHSAAKTEEPVREGMVAMLGPFIDTIVICLMTASVLLITAEDNAPLQALHGAMAQKHAAATALAAASEGTPAYEAAATALANATADVQAREAGALLTSAAFGSVFSWFPYVLSLVVFLFAYSTMISWSYYGERGWEYLFGRKSIVVYRVLFLGAIVLGSVANLGPVIDFSDAMIFLCAFPNIIGGVILSGEVRRRLDSYWGRYREGSFKVYK